MNRLKWNISADQRHGKVLNCVQQDNRTITSIPRVRRNYGYIYVLGKRGCSKHAPAWLISIKLQDDIHRWDRGTLHFVVYKLTLRTTAKFLESLNFAQRKASANRDLIVIWKSLVNVPLPSRGRIIIGLYEICQMKPSPPKRWERIIFSPR